ncbi:MAG: hypothetical protein ABID38_01295 [Candidatus Diapherotrites archaeon]
METKYLIAFTGIGVILIVLFIVIFLLIGVVGFLVLTSPAEVQTPVAPSNGGSTVSVVDDDFTIDGDSATLDNGIDVTPEPEPDPEPEPEPEPDPATEEADLRIINQTILYCVNTKWGGSNVKGTVLKSIYLKNNGDVDYLIDGKISATTNTDGMEDSFTGFNYTGTIAPGSSEWIVFTQQEKSLYLGTDPADVELTINLPNNKYVVKDFVINPTSCP